MRAIVSYWPYLEIAAYTALALGGVWLWVRTRSFEAAIVAAGFILVLPDQIARIAERVQFEASFHGNSEGTFFLFHHHLALQLTALGGLGLAALGLIIHASRLRRA